MMKRMLWALLPIIILLSTYLHSQENNTEPNEVPKEAFAALKDSCKAGDNSYYLIYYYFPGSCYGCLDAMLSQMECIAAKKIPNLHLVLYVSGSREIEVKKYRKDFKHLGTVLRNNGNAQKAMGVDRWKDILLIDPRGVKVYVADYKQCLKENLCGHIYDYIREEMLREKLR